MKSFMRKSNKALTKSMKTIHPVNAGHSTTKTKTMTPLGAKVVHKMEKWCPPLERFLSWEQELKTMNPFLGL